MPHRPAAAQADPRADRDPHGVLPARVLLHGGLRGVVEVEAQRLERAPVGPGHVAEERPRIGEPVRRADRQFRRHRQGQLGLPVGEELSALREGSGLGRHGEVGVATELVIDARSIRHPDAPVALT